ncbi:47_t:CDS:2, partial [Cetraspora pellucida]
NIEEGYVGWWTIDMLGEGRWIDDEWWVVNERRWGCKRKIMDMLGDGGCFGWLWTMNDGVVNEMMNMLDGCGRQIFVNNGRWTMNMLGGCIRGTMDMLDGCERGMDMLDGFGQWILLGGYEQWGCKRGTTDDERWL